MSGYTRIERKLDAIRTLIIEPHIQPNNPNSCLVKLGNTHVLCSAVIEDRVPGFLRNSGKGWLTAEYGMLPSSTNERVDREAARGKQSGRTQEIQRLIGRSLRCAVNLDILGERTIKVDCDVISADGGTRTASIIGGYVSLARAINLYKKKYEDDIIVASSSIPFYNANSLNATTIGFTGFDGGRLKEISSYSLNAMVDDMQISEDIHIVTLHILYKLLNN